MYVSGSGETFCGKEEFHFALVDQGSSAFEGLRVIRHLVRYNLYAFVVVARRKDAVCYLQQSQSERQGYLEKPVSAAELGWMIENLLQT